MASVFRRVRALAVASALFIACAAVRAEDPQWAHLTLQSDPGDYIGLGSPAEITCQTPDQFIVVWFQQTLPDGKPSKAYFWIDPCTPVYNSAHLVFDTSLLGFPIRPGFYPNAHRPTERVAGRPAFEVGFQGRGCNKLTGEFTISRADHFRDNAGELKVAAFDATFEQHCEGAVPALRGQFSYRNYAAVSEPGTLGVCIGVAPLLLFRRRRAGV